MLVTDAPGDVRVFTSRARRLDPTALVRMRPAEPDRVQLWTVLPIAVLAQLTVAGKIDADTTVSATALEKWLADATPPSRADHEWRGALPSDRGDVLEQVPSADCRRIGQAAAETLSQARGQGIGDRRLRDALLDQVVMRVESGGTGFELQLRLFIGLLRMGFAAEGNVAVRLSGNRLGLESAAGAVWNPAPGLALR